MRPALLTAAALLAGCVSARVPLPLSLRVEGAGEVTVRYAEGEAKDAARVERAVRTAGPKLARWGALEAPVSVRVVPSRAQLDDESGTRGLGWLKAWARQDSIVLLAPGRWGLFPPPQSELEQLLLHELTHCLTYQLARTDKTGMLLPLWFREGMALVTAGQGYRLATLEDLARHYQRGGADPLTEPEVLYKTDNALVYGAANHAFAFLLHRYGDEQVKALLARMRGGASFDDAFEKAFNIPEAAFVREFRRYVRWRGFRGGRLIPRLPDRQVPEVPVEDPPP